MNERIPMSAPDITDRDIAAVVDVLRSGRLSLGPMQERFEQAVAARCEVQHAVAVSSGTAALHLLVRALGLGPGDEVLVPSFTFAASVNCILYEHAVPVFVDIQRDTYNLDPLDVERKITPRTKAIVAVDCFGHPADWDALEAIGRTHGLRIIDDSCEALGARHRGKAVGSFGDAAAFAFYANKQITTGEGGIVVTDDPEIARLCRSWRNQGRGQMGAWLEHEFLGYNYRLDEMSAALGVSQMERLDTILARRSAVAELYNERLQQVPQVRIPFARPEVQVSWFVYVITLQPGIDRNEVIGRLAQQGIPSRSYFSPVHEQPYVRELRPGGDGAGAVIPAEGLPVTEDVAPRTLALPFHSNLSEVEVELVVAALAEAVEASSSS